MNEYERCPATIQFRDDCGDNMTTFRCQLPIGHDGPHLEESDMAMCPGTYSIPYSLTWSGSEAEEDEFLGSIETYEQWCCPHSEGWFPWGDKEACAQCSYTRRRQLVIDDSS